MASSFDLQVMRAAIMEGLADQLDAAFAVVFERLLQQGPRCFVLCPPQSAPHWHVSFESLPRLVFFLAGLLFDDGLHFIQRGSWLGLSHGMSGNQHAYRGGYDGRGSVNHCPRPNA